MTAKRILLVDDQRDVTRMLRASLETLGHHFTIVDVPSGEEALLEIKRGGVDLLITDVRLPLAAWKSSNACARPAARRR